MTSTVDILDGLETLLKALEIDYQDRRGETRQQSVNGVHIHPIDENKKFGEWSYHLLVTGDVDDSEVGTYDDMIRVEIRMFGRDASKERNTTSKMLWSFRDKMVEAIEGQPGIDHLGPTCDNWSLGATEVTGMFNGTAVWAGSVTSIGFVRGVPYGM